MTRMRPAPPESPLLGSSAPLESSSVEKTSGSELSPEEAEARTSAKQEEFIERVVKPHSPMLRAIARRLVKPDHVKDLQQDVLLKAWKRDVVAQCGGDARAIREYLKKTIGTCATDYYRKDGRIGERDARYAASALPSGNDSAQPLDYAILWDIIRLVNRTVRRLPRRCFEVFEKVHSEGVSHKKAAEALHMSLGTLKVHLRTINRVLRRELAAVDYYSPPAERGEEREDTP